MFEYNVNQSGFCSVGRMRAELRTYVQYITNYELKQ